jgi:putative chitinase
MPEEEELKNADELYLTDSLLDLAHQEWSQEQIERNYNEREAIYNEFDFFRHMIENGKAKSPKSYGSLYGSDLLGFMEKTPNPETSVIGIGKGAFAIQDTDVVTMKQLKAMFPRAKSEVLEAYLPEFNSQLAPAGINTPKRLAYFFATVNEETGGMTDFVEGFYYKDPDEAKRTFGILKKMSLSDIKKLGHQELFANTVYGNKYGNGDVNSGDGYLFRGRGIFNLTFKENYMRMGGIEFVKNPDLILIPSNDVRLSIKFWNFKKLSAQADMLDSQINVGENGKVANLNFNKAVKPINYGTKHIDRRALSFNRYLKLFKKERE